MPLVIDCMLSMTLALGCFRLWNQRTQILSDLDCMLSTTMFWGDRRSRTKGGRFCLHPEDGHSFRVKEAPGPEEQALADLDCWHLSVVWYNACLKVYEAGCVNCDSRAM